MTEKAAARVDFRRFSFYNLPAKAVAKRLLILFLFQYEDDEDDDTDDNRGSSVGYARSSVGGSNSHPQVLQVKREPLNYNSPQPSPSRRGDSGGNQPPPPPPRGVTAHQVKNSHHLQ